MCAACNIFYNYNSCHKVDNNKMLIKILQSFLIQSFIIDCSLNRKVCGRHWSLLFCFVLFLFKVFEKHVYWLVFVNMSAFTF